MYRYLSGGRKDVVQFTRHSEKPVDGPTTVEFQFNGSSQLPLVVDVKDFQMLRRAVYNERRPSVGDQSENKISLIKVTRSFYGIGLWEAKMVAEYFMSNYTLDCGRYTLTLDCGR